MNLTTRAKRRPALTFRHSSILLLAATMVMAGASAASAKSRSARSSDSFRQANASTDSGGGRSFSGMASFYGNESGSRTASGQRFNASGMTAAHRSLPFGTKLRVTHGGRSVIVTVNDRGPFIRGRVLDLSRGAAGVIGLTSRGVGRVVAEVM